MLTIPSICLGILLVIASVPKLRRPRLAASALQRLRVVTTARTTYGLLLGVAELCLGVGLITAPAEFLPFALFAAAIFFFGATVVIADNLRRRNIVSCFCFGESSKMISRATLLRTSLLLIVALGAAIATLVNPRTAEIADTQDRFLLYVCASAITALLGLTLAVGFAAPAREPEPT